MSHHVIRDFIPDGEKPTAAEQRIISRAVTRKDAVVVQDFIPDPSDPSADAKGTTREEREVIALESAGRSAVREAEESLGIAKAKLKTMTAGEAVTFVSRQSEAMREVYARAELEGEARVDFLKRFKAYLPKTDEE